MGGETGDSRIVLGCSRDEDGDGLIPVIGDVGDITGAGGTNGVGMGGDGGGTGGAGAGGDGGSTRGVGVACTRFRGVCLQTGPPP